MSDNIRKSTQIEPQRTPLEELATELAVDVEALEERLEMLSFEAATCCIVNGSCHISPVHEA